MFGLSNFPSIQDSEKTGSTVKPPASEAVLSGQGTCLD